MKTRTDWPLPRLPGDHEPSFVVFWSKFEDVTPRTWELFPDEQEVSRG